MLPHRTMSTLSNILTEWFRDCGAKPDLNDSEWEQRLMSQGILALIIIPTVYGGTPPSVYAVCEPTRNLLP